MKKIKAPPILHPKTLMTKANDLILIYKGPIDLKTSKGIYNISAEVNFNWSPYSGVTYEGEILNKYKNILHDFLESLDFTMTLNSINTFQTFITSIGSNYLEDKIGGVILGDVIIGDKSIDVKKVRFEIPNFRSFIGDAVKDKNSFKTNRLKLNDGKFEITIDKLSDYEDLKRVLTKSGGYLLLYTGEIKKLKGSISFTESQQICECLEYFLSFINGIKTAPLFRKGFVNVRSKPLWSDFTGHTIADFKSVETWTLQKQENLSLLWQSFRELWKEEDDRSLLTFALHWYLEANKGSGLVEGSIVMIQNALELLYNWQIVETKKMIIDDDADKISAANKIRLLLSQINLDSNVPSQLTSLKTFAVTNKILDAPGTFVEIRNAIVHSQKNKRDRLKTADAITRIEARSLGLLYIELILLNILKYSGKYYNRCTKKEVRVPWDV